MDRSLDMDVGGESTPPACAIRSRALCPTRAPSSTRRVCRRAATRGAELHGLGGWPRRRAWIVGEIVFDLSYWERVGWIVPLGASGHPGSPHYADQAEPCPASSCSR